MRSVPRSVHGEPEPLVQTVTHHYFRVYPNGDRAKALQLTTEEKDELVAYNEVIRFGCAQFVDGKCVYEGCVSKEIIEAVEAAEKEKRT